MTDSIYIKEAKAVMKRGRFKVRPTHNGFEVRDEYAGRHLHTLPCRHAAKAEADKLNAQPPRLVWENPENGGPS